jgi:hypothetical protein
MKSLSFIKCGGFRPTHRYVVKVGKQYIGMRYRDRVVDGMRTTRGTPYLTVCADRSTFLRRSTAVHVARLDAKFSGAKIVKIAAR